MNSFYQIILRVCYVLALGWVLGMQMWTRHSCAIKDLMVR